MLECEMQEKCNGEYVYDTLYGFHNNGEVLERRTFSFDVENQQWLEGVDLNLDVEKEIESLSHDGDVRLFIPYRWTVEALTTGVVTASLHLYMAEVRQGVVQSVQEKEWQIECDLPNGRVQAWPVALLKPRRRGWVGTYSCPAIVTFPDMLGASYVEIPTVVTEAAMAYMQELAEKEFGFRPTYMGNIHGMEHMVAYCLRPLDINIHLLRHVLGKRYETIFPRGQQNNYRPLCRYFLLEHPPKSLRKYYGEAAENFVAYILIRQLGFRDINVIRRFFHRDTLFGYRLLEFSYQARYGKLVAGANNQYFVWLERFCHWFLRNRKEAQLANCLQPLAVQNEWDQFAIDILRMFVMGGVDRDINAMRQDTRRILLREGFTPNVHDLMMEELPGVVQRGPRSGYAHIGNKDISYTDKERAYEDEVEGYCIILPKDTDEIRKYGKAFHNCVASYRLSVLEKRTLILAMKQGEKYIACLEVRQNILVQALGPCNQHLSDEVFDVLYRWADEKKIGYKRRN